MTIASPIPPHPDIAQPRRIRPAAVLTVVLVASLVINVETTIVNVGLPPLVRFF